MQKSMRKGFTLVELLIVMVIIGILAAVMMLSGGMATAQAEGTQIVNDIRTLKTASMMFYTKNMSIPLAKFIDWVTNGNKPAGAESDAPDNAKGIQLLAPFSSSPKQFKGPAGDNYKFVILSDGQWYIGYDLSSRSEAARKYIKGLASSASLVGTTDCATTPPGDDTDVDYEATHKCVWMRAR